ncbi:MAG TPA: DUF4062 domain-containing protein [Thermoleophilia bacterium]|nr:DUF4062 domain-containing protein [Thermoleophilia bacterium]
MGRLSDTDTRSEVIRTPDYRLRVFVSSTLKELAEERDAVRQAILRLRLGPVMFEPGARSHPADDRATRFEAAGTEGQAMTLESAMAQAVKDV